jgi:K+-sensing histidine kinase KdpD
MVPPINVASTSLSSIATEVAWAVALLERGEHTERISTALQSATVLATTIDSVSPDLETHLTSVADDVKLALSLTRSAAEDPQIRTVLQVVRPQLTSHTAMIEVLLADPENNETRANIPRLKSFYTNLSLALQNLGL